MADLAWSAPDQVAVVGESDDAGSARPAVVSVDGSQIDFLSSGPPSLTISAAPDQPTLLGAKDGRVYVEEDGYRWEDVVVGTSPAYPG
jgi:hypothetical protein